MSKRVFVSRICRMMVALLLGGILLMQSTSALASSDGQTNLPKEPTPPFVDLVVTRPLGIAATGVGIALFVPTALLTAIVAPRDMNVPFNLLVWAPIKYTFVDRLGAH